MSGNNISNIRQYSFSSQDRLFFDTNIWYFIYGPQGDPRDPRPIIYSKAYKEVISKDSKIYIDPLVLSEFINRFARFHYNLWNEELPEGQQVEFKTYRKSQEFKAVAQEIEMAVQAIMVDTKPVESGLTVTPSFHKVIQDYGKGMSDFTDLMVVEICRRNTFTLVTDDSDYRVPDISVLTSNRSLLGNP